jgi:hypothetical protein
LAAQTFGQRSFFGFLFLHATAKVPFAT